MRCVSEAHAALINKRLSDLTATGSPAGAAQRVMVTV